MYPFTYQAEHEAEALAIFCMDFRFSKTLHEFIREELKINSYDRVAVAGAGKSLLGDQKGAEYKVLEKQIKLSSELHKIKTVIVAHHIDCGAYGGLKAFDSADAEMQQHLDDMERIKWKIREIIPNVKVIKVFLNLSDDQKAVEPEVIF